MGQRPMPRFDIAWMPAYRLVESNNCLNRVIEMADRTANRNGDPLSEQETRNRLLSAAGEVFAEKGFRSATVRAICQRAGANVAAVNYHFGDKETLYADVLRFSHTCALEEHPPDEGTTSDSSAEERLFAFIHSFFCRVLDEGRPAWHGKLMSREMVEPTGALDKLVKKEIQPRYRQLAEILRQILGPAANDTLIRRCAQSIVGQCIFYHHARPMLERLQPSEGFDPTAIDELADHVFAFSIAALKGLASSSKVKAKAGR
jgi:TetR/AcrR family transcriptional regulator, regulator of cefoperazone and chloramphenicol sensitivity